MGRSCLSSSLNLCSLFSLFSPLPPGKLIICNVTGIAHRRPQGESYDQAIRNDETGLWQCPFCQQDNFPELSEVCAAVLPWSLNFFELMVLVSSKGIGKRKCLDNALPNEYMKKEEDWNIHRFNMKSLHMLVRNYLYAFFYSGSALNPVSHSLGI